MTEAPSAEALEPRLCREPRRVLVLRAGALGDTIVTLPALAALRRGFPDARLVLVGNTRAAPLLRQAGHVDESHPFDDRWVGELFAGEPPSTDLRVRLAEVDLAVVWSRSPDGPAVHALRGLGIPTLAAPSFPTPGVRRHLCDHLLDTLAPLELPVVDPIPRLTVPEADQAFADDFWRSRGLNDDTVVALHVGSGSVRKNWPAERFAAVAERLADAGRRVLLLSGPADAEALATFRRSARTPFVEVEDPALGMLAALLARASAYLGNDSGVSHLAAAVGAPTVAIFGPTDPALWAPRGQRVIVLWRGSVWAASERLSIDETSPGAALEAVGVAQALSAVEGLLAR